MKNYGRTKKAAATAGAGCLLFVLPAKGFTLVELMIVVAFIGIIAQMPLPPGFSFSGFRIDEAGFFVSIANNETLCLACTYTCDPSVLFNMTNATEISDDSDAEALVRDKCFSSGSLPEDEFPETIGNGVCTLDPQSCVPLLGCVRPCEPEPFDCGADHHARCCARAQAACARGCREECLGRERGECIRACVQHGREC